MPKTATKIPRREFLQLAKTYDPNKNDVSGWVVSEKLDGTRCFWDGGLSRGIPTDAVPYASLIDPKTGQPKKKVKPVATGLWSRYGNPIMAPDWFLDSLPAMPLDGELWAGRGNFQLCRSICGGDTPDPRFDQIKFAVYSLPSIWSVFQEGEIKNNNFHSVFTVENVFEFVRAMAPTVKDFFSPDAGVPFSHEMLLMQDALHSENVFAHKQILLPNDPDAARDLLDDYVGSVVKEGAEGAIVRNPNGIWTPKRVGDLLKCKPSQDDEGTLVGFTSGRETNKGSKHLGKIGALILDYQGKRLELSGLTDVEREFAAEEMVRHATDNPGVDMPQGFRAKHFELGQKITFKYRELTDDGIPKEARYFRKREETE